MAKQVTHLIIGLGLGGAETMLYQLLLYGREEGVRHRVINLGQGKHYEKPIRQLGIEVIVLPFKKKPLAAYRRLKTLLRGEDVLCCWMYHANFIGQAAFRSMRKKEGKKLVWNIRHSNLSRQNNSALTLFLNRLCARRSGQVDLIAYNGDEARRAHENAGYSGARAIVLDNGTDLSRFCPDGSARGELLREFGIPPQSRIVLSVAKDSPIKDLPTFLAAFGALHRTMPETVALMCGKGVDKDNEKLCALARKEGLTVGKDLFLLGLRLDVPKLLAGCDLYALHSAGEAFPNTLIQAMACSALCVTTDVGDARRILDNDALTVPPGEPEKLCAAMRYALELDEASRSALQEANRAVVTQRYDIRQIVRSYQKLF